MGLLDFFARRKALSMSPEVIEAAQTGQLNLYQRRGGVNQEVNTAWQQAQSASYAYMYERQPAVRKVIDYIASNAAQLGLKLYERRADDDRRRDTDHPAAQTMEHPNDLGPADEFIRGLVSDYLVHDNAYVLKFRANGGPRVLRRVPAWAVAVIGGSWFTVDGYRIYLKDGTWFDVTDPDDLIHWRSYNPSDPRIGISKLETLRQILAEEAASQRASAELYKAGLAAPGYIKRSLEAPEWSGEAAKRFQESFRNQTKASPGLTPILEEGMEFAEWGISPKDAEMLDGRRFTNEEVASLYGMKNIPPEGEDERKQFYADVLPPLTQSLACQLDHSLLEVEYGAEAWYFEFDMNEKLRGDIENRFQAITAAVGRPWQTANEARARENLPPVDGGDELVTPMNVTVGSNPRPAPNVMPPQNPIGPPQDGSHRESAIEPVRKQLMAPRMAAVVARRANYADELAAQFIRFYNHQEQVLESKGIKAPFAMERWVRELGAALERKLSSVIEREGDISARRFGMIAFDTRMVVNYIASMAEEVAKSINDVTRADLRESERPDVFDRARDVRTPAASMSLATASAAFAAQEAARQSPDAEQRTKTWIVTSANSAHPELDGETVPLGEQFSNGSDGPPADHPACECCLDII